MKDLLEAILFFKVVDKPQSDTASITLVKLRIEMGFNIFA